MRIYHPGQKESGDTFGAVLIWLMILLLGVVLTFCHVLYYELNLETEELQRQLYELRQELYEKEQVQPGTDYDEMARELGMYRPQPEEYRVIKIE